MITLTRPSYYNALRYAEYCGLSTDNKSTIDAVNADRFYEIDTAKIYVYNEASNEWIEQPDDTTAIDTGLPPISSETIGHFLSNDGSVTKWQSIASENFVIRLTEDVDNDTYTADKTWVEIKTAYDESQNIVIRLDGSEMPLMNASIANDGSATLVFGYTEIKEQDGTVVTRAINYLHQDDVDMWRDSVASGEYVSKSGSIMTGALRLVGTPTYEDEAITKKYVDDQVATRVPLQAANQGQIKAYVQNGNKPDVCLISDGGMALCVARYTAKGHLIDQSVPTENNHLANKQYVDTKVAQTGGDISGDLTIDGSLTINGTGSMTGTPTQNVDLVNKGYLDSSMIDVVRKSSIAVGANSSVNVPLSNGVYLLTVADDMHGGLICVAVYSTGMTITGIVNLNNWTCERVSGSNTISLTNSASTDMTIYITSIGEGSYR